MASNNDERKKLINAFKKIVGNSNSNNFSTMLKRLKQQQQLQEYLSLAGKKPVPSSTPYFNKTLRRFFYDDKKGFYIVLGVNKNGKKIIRQMPGLFYYKNIGWRIVPIRPRRR
jgi:uncharacterized FlaG/YvyC family protein